MNKKAVEDLLESKDGVREKVLNLSKGKSKVSKKSIKESSDFTLFTVDDIADIDTDATDTSSDTNYYMASKFIEDFESNDVKTKEDVLSELDTIFDNGIDSEWADDFVSIYNADRIEWLKNGSSSDWFCEQAVKEGLFTTGGAYDLLGAGEYLEAVYSINAVANAIREYVESL